MGMFALPNPADFITDIKDDNLKRAAITLGMSVAYSQTITFLYEFGTALKARKYIGWLGDIFIRQAASMFAIVQFQSTVKVVYLGIPRALVNDAALLNSIWLEKKN